LQSDIDGDLLLYVVDLYARDGPRPNSLEAAAERKNDLLFGNQTLIRLEYCAELRKSRRQLRSLAFRDRIVVLSYRPGAEEPGPEKSFDLSVNALAQRWTAGLLDMEHAANLDQADGLALIRRTDSRTRN
jgi:NTE family protein